jgi:DNA-directed RNA polymerase subunit beta'
MLELRVPKDKKERMKLGDDKANKVYNMFYNGFLSEEEKHRLITKLRTEIKADMEVVVKDNTFQGDDLYTMVTSGAKGSFANVTQISGMKGLVMNPK